MDELYMEEALRQAKKAFKNGEVPVGAVVVKNEKIIARGYNKKEKSKDGTNHAEIIAIKKACKVQKDWRLNDCTLYVTLEPCLMCVGAAIETRMERLVYGTKNNKKGYENIEKKLLDINGGVMEKEATKIIKSFFKEKRKK